ncbi:MAG TPA: carbohydrate kinase family protein [Candidatus Thermoplasmatota archaeon]|nr:carbohydrate kinase family protein [Candidatus Thermoplasmatota archaeon]
MDLPALARKLREADPGRLHVVALPDFFVDHFVTLPRHADIMPEIGRVHGQGGGNLPGFPQRLSTGGNAANTALALARLGVKSHLITRTSPFGATVLSETLGRAGVDLARVKPTGDLAVTTALEFDVPGAARRNVMLNWPGSVATFGVDDLDQNDWTLIEASDLVLVANWTLTREGGTELAQEVFRVARKAGTRTAIDTGDPSPRAAEIPTLVGDLLRSKDVDVLGVNENELRHFTGAVEAGVDEARAFAGTLSGTLDYHTSSVTASFGRAGEAVVPTFDVHCRRVTGAGDAWNAGNLTGHLLGLAPAERLVLANAVAGLYVSGMSGDHPTLEEVARFLESGPRTSAIPP